MHQVPEEAKENERASKFLETILESLVCSGSLWGRFRDELCGWVPEDHHLTGETTEGVYGNISGLGHAHFPMVDPLHPSRHGSIIALPPQYIGMRIHQWLLQLTLSCCFSAPRLGSQCCPRSLHSSKVLMLDPFRQWRGELKADPTSPSCWRVLQKEAKLFAH